MKPIATVAADAGAGRERIARAQTVGFIGGGYGAMTYAHDHRLSIVSEPGRSVRPADDQPVKRREILCLLSEPGTRPAVGKLPTGLVRPGSGSQDQHLFPVDVDVRLCLGADRA